MNKRNLLFGVAGGLILIFSGLISIALMVFVFPILLFYMLMAILRREKDVRDDKFKEVDERLKAHDENYKVLTDLMYGMREDVKSFLAGSSQPVPAAPAPPLGAIPPIGSSADKDESQRDPDS